MIRKSVNANSRGVCPSEGWNEGTVKSAKAAKSEIARIKRAVGLLGVFEKYGLIAHGKWLWIMLDRVGL